MVVGLGAPGWELDNVSCFSNTPGTSWVIAGATATIALSEGDVTECIYYYRSTPVPPAVVVPTLSVPLLALLALALAGAGYFASRTRQGWSAPPRSSKGREATRDFRRRWSRWDGEVYRAAPGYHISVTLIA